MQDSLLYRFFAKVKPAEGYDPQTIYTDPPESAAETFPEVPLPDDPLSPPLLASRWISGDLRGEHMPGIAADLLEAGYDSHSLRRLAGEMEASSSAALEPLVKATFGELDVNYPISESDAKISIVIVKGCTSLFATLWLRSGRSGSNGMVHPR